MGNQGMVFKYQKSAFFNFLGKNKANLRDLIDATSLVISNWIQIVNFSARVTVKFDGWPKKNNRALLLYCCLLFVVKLCASFQIHWWIQTGITVQKHSIWFEIGDMLSHVTLKFDGRPWNTIRHLFYATSSFVQHFIAIAEIKLELQSGNAQSGSNSMFFRAVQPWNLTDDLEKQ